MSDDDILFTHVPSSKEMKEKEECKEKKGWKTCRKGIEREGNKKSELLPGENDSFGRKRENKS